MSVSYFLFSLGRCAQAMLAAILAAVPWLCAGRVGPAPAVSVRKPPLGFNTWNHFHMLPTADLLLETAANFSRLGLRDAGYRFINTDDGWLSRDRSPAGDLVPMPAQFPDGIAPL